MNRWRSPTGKVSQRENGEAVPASCEGPGFELGLGSFRERLRSMVHDAGVLPVACGRHAAATDSYIPGMHQGHIRTCNGRAYPA